MTPYLRLLVSVCSASWLLKTSFAVRADVEPLHLDCGATQPGMPSWNPDMNFTGGITASIAAANSDLNPVEATLRYFPTDATSCYNISRPTGRYLVRLGFAYFNYDNHNDPPRFNVLLQDTLVEVVDMAIVQQDTEGTYYTDYIAFAPSGAISVCFQPQPGGNGSPVAPPIVNSLEVAPVDTESYDAARTGPNVILSTYLRLNMGSTTPITDAVDPGYRNWLADVNSTVGKYTPIVVSANQKIADVANAPDYLPEALFATAREAVGPAGATGFRMTIVPVSPSNRWYLRYYFMETNSSAMPGDRVFQVLLGSGNAFSSIGNDAEGFDILQQTTNPFLALVVPVFFNYTQYSQSYGQDLEVGVKTLPGSKLPALINGVELYEVIPVGNAVPSPPSSSGGGGLSGGAIAGIVIGSVIGALLLAGLAVLLLRRDRNTGFAPVSSA